MKKLPLWATFAPKRVPKICLFSNQRSQNWHKISLWATFAPKRGPKISHFNHKNKSKLTRRFWATFFLALGDFLPKPSGHTVIIIHGKAVITASFKTFFAKLQNLNVTTAAAARGFDLSLCNFFIFVISTSKIFFPLLEVETKVGIRRSNYVVFFT